jgi:hypothetical protein
LTKQLPTPFIPPTHAFDSRGCYLAERVREEYVKYVAFHSDFYDAEADTLALWTIHTHVFGAAEITPYLHVVAPTPEAGKSRVIDVARYLVLRPEVVVDPSAAGLYRLIDAERPTLFIDEADQLLLNRQLKAVLNKGFEYGGYVVRSLGKAGYERIGVFCPKLVAGIAGRKLPLTGATLSRCIEIPIRRRTAGEVVAPFKHRDARRECEPLRAALVVWGESVEPKLLGASPTIPTGLTDRQGDAWEPLLAIAERLGRDWPQRAANAALTLSKRASAQPDDGTQIIADLKDAWNHIEGERAHTATLAEIRNRLEDRRYSASLSAYELSTWLHRFGIAPLPNPIRLGGKQRRGYERAAFADAFERYCQSPAVTAVTP